MQGSDKVVNWVRWQQSQQRFPRGTRYLVIEHPQELNLSTSYSDMQDTTFGSTQWFRKPSKYDYRFFYLPNSGKIRISRVPSASSMLFNKKSKPKTKSKKKKKSTHK